MHKVPERWESSAKLLSNAFPEKVVGIRCQIQVHDMHTSLWKPDSCQPSVEKKTNVSRDQDKVGGKGAFTQSPTIFWLAFQPNKSRVHAENMSQASGLKTSICCKKNEASKWGLSVVGCCQVGRGFPGGHRGNYKCFSLREGLGQIH